MPERKRSSSAQDQADRRLMGILVVTWNFPPRRGGIETLMSELCHGLKTRHAVAVITSYAEGPGAAEGIYRAPWPGLFAFALHALWRGALLLARDRRMGVIFGGSAMVAPIALVLGWVFGRRVVVQTHGLDLLYRSSCYQLVCVRWLRHCHRVVANSNFTASLAVAKGVERRSISVIPPGIHWRRFACARGHGRLTKELGLENRRVILFVGRLGRRKGVKEFIQRSFVTIAQEVPAACLVIAGDNPIESLTQRQDELGEIRGIVARLGLANRVLWLGRLDDQELVQIYQACDLLVLPALALDDDVEGFGIVLLEAAAAEKPAVATRVGGIAEAIEDGKSGVLIEPGDYRRFSQTIIDLLGDDRSRRVIGEYALERIKKQFSWDVALPRYEAVFMR